MLGGRTFHSAGGSAAQPYTEDHLVNPKMTPPSPVTCFSRGEVAGLGVSPEVLGEQKSEAYNLG